MTFRILLFLLAALPALAAPYASELPPAWAARLDALAKPATIAATFTESRHNQLKKKPVVVTGVVRIDRARGLSLAYDQTRAPVIILDKRGLLLRYPDGREQSAPPEAENDLHLLHALFSFDLATLEKAYALAASDAPDGTWTLTFTRRPDADASYRQLALTGNAATVTGISLEKTANTRTVIALADPKLDPVFTAEELTRYFR